MAKSKKSDLEKQAKEKGLKGVKAEKAGKEKKGGKKEKAAEAKAPKKPAAVKAKPAPAPKAAKPKAAPAAYTLEDISLRAYFIAERRQAMGWPGDSTSDWVEAERQLKAESARKAL